MFPKTIIKKDKKCFSKTGKKIKIYNNMFLIQISTSKISPNSFSHQMKFSSGIYTHLYFLYLIKFFLKFI